MENVNVNANAPFEGIEVDGIWIEDPSLCEAGMDDVDPRAYYGIAVYADSQGNWFWCDANE